MAMSDRSYDIALPEWIDSSGALADWWPALMRRYACTLTRGGAGEWILRGSSNTDAAHTFEHRLTAKFSDRDANNRPCRRITISVETAYTAQPLAIINQTRVNLWRDSGRVTESEVWALLVLTGALPARGGS
jgi:hypothetical protein